MINKMYTILEKVSNTAQFIAIHVLALIMLIMVVFTGLQVGCRYILDMALIWPEELNVFLMAWITFIGSSVALKRIEHIGIGVFVAMLPEKICILIQLLGHLFVAFIIILITKYGFLVAMMNTSVVSDALGVPMIIPRLALVFGGFLMFIQILWLVFVDIHKLIKLPSLSTTIN